LQERSCVRLAPADHALKRCDPGPSFDGFDRPPNSVFDVFPGADLLGYEHRRSGFRRQELLYAQRIVVENGAAIIQAWHGCFGI
jgi:hypothetical protein